jgi:ankyrin repeat protein
MALLYPQSKKLQSYLAEYFIAVVGLCHTMFKFTHKSTIGQFASSLSDSELKTYQSDLDLWANSIKEEVSMLVAKKIEEEAQENTRFRALLSKGSKSKSLEQKLKTRLRVLDFCSMYDYETPWKQTRKVGNATLFNRTTDYHDWKGQVDSCTLLYTGKLGSGKSVLLANIVDDLNLYVHSKDIVVTYFFCRYDIPESLKAGTIIRSLVRQLLRPIPDLDIAAEFLDDTTSVPDFEHLFSLLRRALPSTYRAYFILDGLDECDYTERSTLILQLRKLQDTITMLVCISFRLEPDNALKFSPEEFTAPRSISMSEDNPDIEIFIEKELENCIESKKLVIGNPTLILEIRDALLQGSQGMFLWVALQILSLCAMKTDKAIRQALRDLPKDLSETFSRILARSEVVGQPYQRRILELVTVAQRPLQVEELREALSVVPGNTTWDPAGLLNDIYSTLACCGSLVIVDEEELTVRLVHHSFKTFLLTGFDTSTCIGFTTAEAHKTMTNIIVTYLNYGIFETQLSTTVVPQIMTGSVPSRVIRSTLDSSGSVQSLALKLLRSKRAPSYNVGQTLAEARKLFNDRSVDEFHFHSYAKSCWQQHILYNLELEPVINSLLLRLLKNCAVDASMTAEYGQTLLSQAAGQGNKAVVALLLETGADMNTADRFGQTPLLWAVENGHIEVVELLLKKGADMADQGGWTALSWASSNGHVEFVELLLKKGADVNMANRYGWTALTWALENRHVEVVELLLKNGADINTTNKYEWMALSWASENGHVKVVELLLKKGADVNTADEYRWTALTQASENGHVKVVELLLKKGADVNMANRYGWTALTQALKNRHVEVVELLLKKEADVANEIGWMALSWASGDGYIKVVELLLEKGFDIANANGQIALSQASENGHIKVVELLLKKGANINMADEYRWTALTQASENGHVKVVELLLENGADVNMADGHGRTPLSQASGKGHIKVVELLLKNGADPGLVERARQGR